MHGQGRVAFVEYKFVFKSDDFYSDFTGYEESDVEQFARTLLWASGKEPKLGAAVTVADGRAYTMGFKGNEDRVYCLDAGTGKVVWEFSYPAALDPKLFEGGPTSTPVVSDGIVCVVSRVGELHCLDAATGKKLWSTDWRKTVRSPDIDLVDIGAPNNVHAEMAIAALEAGAVDAAFFVSAPTAPYLKDLLRAPGIRLMDLRLSESYSKVLPFLRPVLLMETVRPVFRARLIVRRREGQQDEQDDREDEAGDRDLVGEVHAGVRRKAFHAGRQDAQTIRIRTGVLRVLSRRAGRLDQAAHGIVRQV
jgi:hypothetical protein